MHFSFFAVCAPDVVDVSTCLYVVTSLQEFVSRFTDVRSLAAGFKLFNSFFDFPAPAADYVGGVPM